MHEAAVLGQDADELAVAQVGDGNLGAKIVGVAVHMDPLHIDNPVHAVTHLVFCPRSPSRADPPNAYTENAQPWMQVTPCASSP